MSKMGSQSVVADGLADLPEAFVWVFISKHTHFITPKAQIYKMQFFVDQKYTLNLHFLMHESFPLKMWFEKKMSLQLFILYFTIIFWRVSIDLFYNRCILTFRYICMC